MEHLLIKMARQLDALDEESLMAMWDNYAEKVNNFEPSKRWEEAVLVFSLIQAKRWKNQLFNQKYTASLSPDHLPYDSHRIPVLDFPVSSPQPSPERKAKLLQFVPKQPPNDS